MEHPFNKFNLGLKSPIFKAGPHQWFSLFVCVIFGSHLGAWIIVLCPVPKNDVGSVTRLIGSAACPPDATEK